MRRTVWAIDWFTEQVGEVGGRPVYECLECHALVVEDPTITVDPERAFALEGSNREAHRRSHVGDGGPGGLASNNFGRG